MKRKDTFVVHEKDLEELLISLEMIENIGKGNIKCYFCEKIIRLENIQSIFPLNNRINFCCNNLMCYNKVLKC